MYYKEVLRIKIILISLLNMSVYTQTYHAIYDTISIFSKYDKPCKIGIFINYEDDALEKEFLEEVAQNNKVLDNFIFYPFETLKLLVNILEIEKMNFREKEILNKLKSNFDIDLIMELTAISEREVNIILVETQSGEMIYNNLHMNSLNSKIINDVIKLFSDNKTTIYKKVISDLPEMVKVEKGEIIIPKNRYKNDTLRIYESFYISKYECTVRQFAEFIKSTGYKTTAEIEGSSFYYFNNPKDKSFFSHLLESIYKFFGFSNNVKVDSFYFWMFDEFGNIRNNLDSSDYPVINVSWYDAMQYCNWLSKKTGEKYRLPTFNEWLFAAYGGTNVELFEYSGGNFLDSLGWYRENSEFKIHKVGEKKPNQLGLYDMSGNLREWCLDAYKENDERKIVANGSWFDSKRNCKINYSTKYLPNMRSNILGFRVVKEIR